MLRTEIFKKYKLYYDPSFIHAEDYELWTRIMENHKISNLQEVLLHRRIHKGSVGDMYNKIQMKNANKVRLYLLDKLDIYPTPQELAVHQAISYWQFKSDNKFVYTARHWLIKLFIANIRKNYYHQVTFFNVLVKKWFLI